MKTKIKFMLVALMATVIFSSCERVAPNYAGVLMENYGKKGKNDFKIVSGKVSTWEPGGGPFLTYNQDGTVSLQILESS